MALADDFSRAPGRTGRLSGFAAEVLRTMALSLSALAAGWHAASDYRRHERMSEHRLRSAGTSRSDLPREIYRRHFADLRAKGHRK